MVDPTRPPAAAERVEVRVERRDGGPVVVKRAEGSDARARLAHEASILHRCRHPGVVAAVAVGEGDGGAGELVLRWIGTRSLADVGPLPPARVAALGAALSETVADLHDLGVAHRRITADHVLLDADGRPVLCGFGDALEGPVARPGAPDDVADLGRLVRGLLDGGAEGGTGRREETARRAVAAVVDAATVADDARRPTARALAERLARAAVDARGAPTPPTDPADDRRPPATAPDADRPSDDALEQLRRLLDGEHPARAVASRARLVAVGVLGAGVVVAVAALAPWWAGADRTTIPRAPTVTPTSDPAADPAATSARPSATTAAAPTGTAAGDDARPVVEVDGRRFAVGEPGDVVAVGDWACTGRRSAAVLRPATGDVFVFTTWAPPGGTAEVGADARIPGAVALRAGTDPTCAGLVAVTDDGRRVPVPLPGGPP